MTPPIDWQFPYPSQRMPVLARRVVATSQPLAAQAGLDAMRRGGNAVDAALAAAITLTVVEPNNNGLGSDAFALVWDGAGGRLHGLNASGRSPAALTAARFAGRTAMPTLGWDAVTVPGAVSGWVALSERFGRLPFAALFERAIEYAEGGFLVSPKIAGRWADAVVKYRDFPDWQALFAPDGRAPRPGEAFRAAAMARSMRLIAESRGEAFYRGELAEAIAAHARATGGLLAADDLAAHTAEWVEPIATDFAGLRLHEIPPNGQGLAALIALGILRHTPIADHAPNSGESVHLQLEAMKLAFADAHRYIADPAAMAGEWGGAGSGGAGAAWAALLDDNYLRGRAALIDVRRAGAPDPGRPISSDTVYLCAADGEGRMVSFIQSNFHGFGSGIVVPNTGISLQNRGCGFSLDPAHPNCVAGAKKPFHTIIPGFITDAASGAPVSAFGVMGGPMQPQGHVQMMVRLGLHGQNPQACCDAPRWITHGGRDISLEAGFGDDVARELSARGHAVAPASESTFGGAQMIYRLADGYLAASEPRKDGQAVGY